MLWRRGFTVVEMVVVIAVIGILSSVVLVGYGAWNNQAIESRLKQVLVSEAAAMEQSRTASNAYPAALPSSVSVDSDMQVVLSNLTDKSYCIDANLTTNTAIKYYIDNSMSTSGPKSGTCATRTNLPVPDVPSGVAIFSAYLTTVQLSWNAAANATGYVAQCASDPAFIVNTRDVTVTATSASITGLTFNATYYCHVKAVNNTASSAWSAALTATTNNTLGALPAGASIDGYWSTPPDGFLLEDGSAVSRTTYAALFAVIGTSFGAGDNSTTFNLPDSRGRTAVNLSLTDAEFDTIGEKYGEKAHTLTIAEMASHTHIQNAHNHTQDAHAHSIVDPGHNHSQNAHSHGFGPSSNGDAVGLCCGGGGGWSLGSGNNNVIFGLNSTSVAAANNGAYTNISYASTVATNQSTVATNQYTGGGGAHNNIQPSIVKTSAIKFSDADSNAPSLPAGTSIQGYWASVPSSDYLAEDGSAVSRTTNSALFTAIGTTYGSGDGSTTFNLPDSRGRIGVNISTTDTEFDTMGEKYGTKTETLTVAQIPSHTHTQDAHTHIQNAHTHTVSDPGHNHSQQPHSHEFRNTPNGDFVGMAGGGQGGWALRVGTSNNNIYRMAPTATTATNNAALTGVGVYNATATNQSTVATNQNTGGDGPHNNIQPTIVKRSVIKKTAGVNASSSMPVGSSISGYWSAVPSGYLAEDGSAVSRTIYANLFAAIGTAYGSGDGSTTFNLPDSRGRTGVNRSPSDTEFDTLGEKPGSKTETITIATMPSHTHIQNAHTHTQDAHTHSVYDPGHTHSQNGHIHSIKNTQDGNWAGRDGGSGGGWGISADDSNNNNIFRMITAATTATNNGAYSGISLGSTVATNQYTTATNQNAGGGGSHNNIMPSIVKKYVIKY